MTLDPAHARRVDALAVARRALADQSHALMLAGEFPAARAILDTLARLDALASTSPAAPVVDLATRRER